MDVNLIVTSQFKSSHQILKFQYFFSHVSNTMLFGKAGGRSEYICFEVKYPTLGFWVDPFIIAMADSIERLNILPQRL